MPIEWSEDARAEFERWLTHRLPGDGFAVSAARERARVLVEAELEHAPQPVQTGELQHALARARLRAVALHSAPGEFARRINASALFTIVAVMPFVSLFVEMTIGLSKGLVFDPIPSFAHVLLIVAVPITAMITWSSARTETLGVVSDRIAFAHGATLAVAGVYFLAYVPHILLALFGILAFGLGFAALEPIACFPALVYLAVSMQRRSLTPARTRGAIWLGAALGLALFAAAEGVSLAHDGATVTHGALHPRDELGDF